MILAFIAALAASPPQCASVEVVVDRGDMPTNYGVELTRQTTANFAAAYAQACRKGLLKDKALVPPESKNPGRVFLFNSPNANVASIYTADNGQTLLEYHFVSEDGQKYIPGAEELEEAIYCAVVGATEVEQEESGRCLPD
jgi:hypothetical protein